MLFILLAHAFRYAINGLTVVEFLPGAHSVSRKIGELMLSCGMGEELPEQPADVLEKITHCIRDTELTAEQQAQLYEPCESPPQPSKTLHIQGINPGDLFSGEQLVSAIQQVVPEGTIIQLDTDQNAAEPNAEPAPATDLETQADEKPAELQHEIAAGAPAPSDETPAAAEPEAESSPAKPAKADKKHR